jgi:hypothetical protein
LVVSAETDVSALVLGKYIEAAVIAVLLARSYVAVKPLRRLPAATASSLKPFASSSFAAADKSGTGGALIMEMRTLGVRTVMVTGDAPATAASGIASR